ncbi:HigA family addiction module antitoxin [Rhizobium sp. C4]|nr:HigA family addiction module antitoxin [Rhizobium sp. C4]
MADYQLTQQKLASEIGIEQDRLGAVLDAAAALDADLALRLSRYFSNSPEYWLNLQRTYDLAVALKQSKGLDAIRPIQAA